VDLGYREPHSNKHDEDVTARTRFDTHRIHAAGKSAPSRPQNYGPQQSGIDSVLTGFRPTKLNAHYTDSLPFPGATNITNLTERKTEMKRIIFSAAVLLLFASAVFTVRTGSRGPLIPPSSAVTDLASHVASQQNALNLLNEKIDHLASLIAANNGGLQGMAADSADSLEHKLTSLSDRVDSLTHQLANASRYGEQIDRGLVGIDTKLSTPAMLSRKLDRLQKGLKP
jgi:hypothetical protein